MTSFLKWTLRTAAVVLMCALMTPTAAAEKFNGKLEHCASSDSNRVSVFVGGFYYGLGATHSGGLTGLTQEVGLLNAVGVGYKFGDRNSLSLGIGYQYKWYALKRDYRFTTAPDGSTAIIPWLDGTRRAASELRMHTFQFPLLYSKGFAKAGRFHIGVILDWNIYASYRNGYKVDNTTVNEVTNKLCQNKCTVDLMGALQWKALGVYVRYSPCKVFKSGCGPLMDNTWSVGLALGM